jgi:hypothetical protein
MLIAPLLFVTFINCCWINTMGFSMSLLFFAVEEEEPPP